jgi:hypothetical protein
MFRPSRHHQAVTFIMCEIAAIVRHGQCWQGNFKPVHVIKLLKQNCYIKLLSHGAENAKSWNQRSVAWPCAAMQQLIKT